MPCFLLRTSLSPPSAFSFLMPIVDWFTLWHLSGLWGPSLVRCVIPHLQLLWLTWIAVNQRCVFCLRGSGYGGHRWCDCVVQCSMTAVVVGGCDSCCLLGSPSIHDASFALGVWARPVTPDLRCHTCDARLAVPHLRRPTCMTWP